MEYAIVNETARAFDRGRLQGFKAGVSNGVSVALMALQMERDSTKSPTRRKVLQDAIEAISRIDLSPFG